MQKLHISIRMVAVIGLWLSLCVTSFSVLMVYAHTPSDAGAPGKALADPASFQIASDRPTAVMFLHPKCPCSEASVEQLARLQARYPDRFALRMIFVIPQGEPDDWHEGRLWDQASRLKGGVCFTDPGGHLARAAGAETSGTLGMYDPRGNVLFWGGVTASRGHAGDNAGTDALASLLDHDSYKKQTVVYGCSLLGTQDVCMPEPGGCCDERE